jgi:hypothetical protein
MAMPVTHYAKSGDVHIAYQVFGSGPIDLVLIPGFVSHIENYWEGIVTLPWGQARSVGGSGIFRLLRRRSAMCPSPQREARGAFGLR